ncbi:DNA replication protein [Halobacteroides halobius DSM 5150]|uniref:DNA replication protein n=1 Tax=Halobacteroides halobius (strain ATCC 35273 / DSM 5150 / MD-1) TaxID=748449 RepID=L0K7W6_HALHC|nr:ATP-binding protein [Halobacteroides halobius]AGB40444.1 DNA replication protein [Halobacteroides halobius DSM 5150]
MELVKNEVELGAEKVRKNWRKNIQTTDQELEEDYDCSLCQDRGFYQPEGKEEMVRCKCNQLKTFRKKIRSARIPTRFKNSRLDNFEFKAVSHKKAHQHAVVLAKEVDKFIANNWGLYLQGPPSQGKTKLQASIVNELCVEEDYLGVMVNVREFLSDLKDAIGEGRLNEMLRAIGENQIVALNDLTGGKRPTDSFTEFERGVLYRLIDAIYEKSKTIIITAKYNYDWLQDKLGQDVRDRIQEMCGQSIIMRGYNWRRQAGEERDELAI